MLLFYERGSVLVPVLLLSTLLTLGMILILQNQIIQKKSIRDFKEFVKNRRDSQQSLIKFRLSSIEDLLKKNNVALVQKERKNMHYRHSEHYFFFQLDQNIYFHKANLDKELVLFEPFEIDYLNTKLKLIQTTDSNQYVIYLYDQINDKVALKKKFSRQPFHQLVGEPINSLYIQDKLYLYKIDFASHAPLDIEVGQPIFSRDQILDLAPVITRDAKGDGRDVVILTEGEPIVYHESSKFENCFLDDFEHFYFQSASSIFE